MFKKPLYIYRQVINTDDFREWARKNKIQSMLAPGDLHVTVCYSKESFIWPKSQSTVFRIIGANAKIAYFGEEKDVLVLQFSDKMLENRWQELSKMGASTDFSEYKPHITISYKSSDSSLKLQPYNGEIILGPEIFEEIKEEFDGCKDLEEIKP